MFLHVYRESISTIFSVQTEKGFVMGSEIFGLYNGQAITKTAYNHLSETERAQVVTGDALQTALQGKKEMKITINGTKYDLSTQAGKNALGDFLVKNGYEFSEVMSMLENPLGIDMGKIKEKLDIHDADPANKKGRADNVLLLDADRYAKVEPFSEQPTLPENQFFNSLKETFPKEKYPKLYKKDGSLNEGKAWKELEKEALFEGFYGKSRKDRIAELIAQGKSQESAEAVVNAQNAQILKVEENIERKRMQDSSYEPTEEEQKILDARTGAHDLIKNMKTLKKNVDKSTKRINNAIDKMNSWDWNKDLNKDQQERIRNAVLTYSKDQARAINPNASEAEQLEIYNAIFDENGNVPKEKKNAFYQFMMDYVVGTDGQVNKSAKKGNFFQKLFQKRNMEGTEKRASRELGMDKKDIEKMGFDWEGQINWGKALLDGIPAGALGAVFGAALSRSDASSDSATAHAEAKIDAQDISGETPYSGSVDYMVNGEVVMQIPYNGVVKCLHHIPGAFASDSQTATAFSEAKVSAVLPSALIATGAAVLNSAVDQGINGNEADVFNNNLYQVLSTKGDVALAQDPDDPTGNTPIDIPSGVAKRAGLKPGTAEFRLASDIVKYYIDDKGEFHKTEFLTDWQYNGGYDSKYLNKEEAAMWLNNLKERGPIKSNTPNNQVTGNISVTGPLAYSINAFTGKDQGGLARTGATGTHASNTTYDFAEGLSGEVITSMKDPNASVTEQPDIIRGFDHSNQYGDVHEYRYEQLTSGEIEEAKRQGQLPRNLASDAVIYKLVSVVDHAHTDADGKPISIKSNHVELFQLESTEQNVNDNVTSNAFRLIQPKGFAGYNRSAILSIGTINELITRLNGGQPRL